MTRIKKIVILILIIALISSTAAFSAVRYTPSIALSNCMSITHADKNTWYAYNLNLRITPFSLMINKHTINLTSIPTFTSGTNVKNNILLQGYWGIGAAIGYIYSFTDFYSLEAEIGYSFLFHQLTNNIFTTLKGSINNYFFINDYFALSVPLTLQYRNGFYDFFTGISASFHLRRKV